MKTKITSKIILDLLLQKHSKDLCIPECKTGSTWMSRELFKIDLWVMKKSWAQPYTYCYEIKVDRSDFLNDQKWNNYLKYCSDFYFVTPPGIIEPNELPKEAGLLITSVNGKKLYTKKKAVSRLDTKIPESLFRYILMWRSIQKKEENTHYSKTYWKEWMKEKEIDYRFGHYVSKNIRKKIDEKINKVSRENSNLKEENKKLEEIKELLSELRYNPEQIRYNYYNIKNTFKDKINKISKGDTGNFKGYLEDTKRNIEKAISILEEKE